MIKHSSPPAPTKLFVLLLLVFGALLSPGIAHSETGLNLPAQYGEVIYQLNPKNPNQLFIIALSHRDSLTLVNAVNTSKVQAEVYQVGDWLIHQQGIELLLPEGFFQSEMSRTGQVNIQASPVKNICTGSTDMQALETRLCNEKVYVNAEMLLKENHPLRTRQVEDRTLYFKVLDGLHRLVNGGKDSFDAHLKQTELEYLQDLRTAAMLQAIPKVIEEEFHQGKIKSREAIFTIGMAHIHSIIRYLNECKIRVCAPLVPSGQKDYIADLNLKKENFGVTIILPRTLADDSRILEVNRLDQIAAQLRAKSQPPAPRASSDLP